MLFLVLLVLASSVDASGVLLRQALAGQNVTLGDIWTATIKVSVNQSHTYTLESLNGAQEYVDDHIGVSIDNGPWNFFRFWDFPGDDCQIRGAASVTKVSTTGFANPFVIAKINSGNHTLNFKLYNCAGLFGNNALVVNDDSGSDIFVSITRNDLF